MHVGRHDSQARARRRNTTPGFRQVPEFTAASDNTTGVHRDNETPGPGLDVSRRGVNRPSSVHSFKEKVQ